MIYAGVFQYYAQVTSIVPSKSMTLSKLFSVQANAIDKEKSKDILPSVVLMVASVQVSEGVKYLTGQLDNMLTNKVFMIDVLTNNYEVVEFK